MSDEHLSAELAELFEIADAAVALVLEDRADALAEGRDPITIWDLFGHDVSALALAEQRLERAMARAGSKGEA